MLRSTTSSNIWSMLVQNRSLRRILPRLHLQQSSKLHLWTIKQSQWRRRAAKRIRRRQCPSGWCWFCFQFLVP
uniref:Uncharacterized protein n=1 Tax=Arundo donax TaxID=35708 RepID=A0A0A9E1K6_ARUDO